MGADVAGGSPAQIVVDEPGPLDAQTRRAVLALATAAAARDGEPPLSDQALSQLGSPAVVHLIARLDDRLAGYAQIDGAGVEVVGEPDAVAALLDAALLDVGQPARAGPLRVWSHGERSNVAPVLRRRGYRPVRTLHQLHRDLSEPIPDVPLAEGVTVRDFVPGQDEQGWLALNAAAFATHPEQGRWTQDDLEARKGEPWFDPHGFLLAERAGRLIGFHWTKVHPDGSGEVYVLGVHPEAQGLRLGPALLVRGLQRLAARGCPQVLLYVDDDNAAAMRLYERLGFTHSDADTQWEGPAGA